MYKLGADDDCGVSFDFLWVRVLAAERPTWIMVGFCRVVGIILCRRPGHNVRRTALAGPIIIGPGRHCGFGTFAVAQ